MAPKMIGKLLSEPLKAKSSMPSHLPWRSPLRPEDCSRLQQSRTRAACADFTSRLYLWLLLWRPWEWMALIQEFSRLADQIFVSMGGREQNLLSSSGTGFWCSPATTTAGVWIPLWTPSRRVLSDLQLPKGRRYSFLSLLSSAAVTILNYITRAQMHLVIHALFFFPLFYGACLGQCPWLPH